MSFYKRFLSLILTSLCCLTAGIADAQQNFPILANLRLTPPYSLYLNDYTAPGAQKLQLDLFLKDLTKQNYPFRLRVKIEGFGITIASKPDFYVEPFYLNASEMRVMYGEELSKYLDPANLVFQGLDLNTFQNGGGKLPEGVYRISFEALDYNNKKVVSNAGSNVIAAYLSYPPIINLPNPTTKVLALDPQNVIFQWTPRHTGSVNAAYNVAYKFSLVELNPPNRDPNDAINTTTPLFETFTDQTFMVYGPAEPQLVKGNNYAVRVQAVEATGRDIFLNNGYSEVAKFRYGVPCEMPNYVFAEVAGSNSIKVSWGQLPNQVSFSIRYREADNASAVWFEEVTNETSYIISGLRSGREYEYQVKAQCIDGYGDYTPVQTFQVPDESMLQGDLVCGQTQPGSSLSSVLYQNLRPDMFFMAGSFPIKVTSVSGTNGVYTGAGTIGIPLFNNLNFFVTFENISINEDLKLINGKVTVATQPLDSSVEQLMADLTITPDANGNVKAIYKDELPNFINVTIADPKVLPVYHPVTNSITFIAKTEDGTSTREITVELVDDSQPPYVFQDKTGETYRVAEDGTVTSQGKIPAKELLSGSALTAQAIDRTKASITFSLSSNQAYGLDLFNTTLAANEKYNVDYKLANDANNPTSRIDWKSIEAGGGDEVKATVNIIDSDLIKPEKLEFRTGKGEKVSYTHHEGTNNYTIKLVGAPAGSDKEVYAYYPTSTEVGMNIGKLNIASFNKISKKVIIVPVNGAGLPLDAASLKEQINNIYAQAVVSWDVQVAGDFAMSLGADGLEAGSSSALSAYTTEQKKLASAYKAAMGLENETYYIFVVNQLSDASQGYMVRGGQVGFVKAGAAVAVSIAHELGHGAFNLEHTWEDMGISDEPSRQPTKNLMDYGGGKELWYAQWKYMRNPDLIVRPFESDEEGAYETDGHYSTVQLVSLMLRMNPKGARRLAIATEAPDTEIHSDIDFELNDSWAYPGPQTEVHSLTGGFHGVEEMMTAFKFLYTDISNTTALGKLLHRYGDTYAHTRLDNLTPNALSLRVYSDEEELERYVEFWKDKGSYNIEPQIKPWIQYLNHYIKIYGYKFLTDGALQRKVLKGDNLVQYLHKVYLKDQPAASFRMYGNGIWTTDHLSTDDSSPDWIWVRPQWYLSYVKNLATLIAYKYKLDIRNLDMRVFDRMVAFASRNRCSLKGVIDYEIAKRLGRDKFFVPVYYAGLKGGAIADALRTNYEEEAKKAVFYAKSYAKQYDGKDIVSEKKYDTPSWTVSYFKLFGFEMVVK